MSKRKCFCSDCDGKIRSWNTVKRHRTLQRKTVPLGSSSLTERGNAGSSDEESAEKVVVQDKVEITDSENSSADDDFIGENSSADDDFIEKIVKTRNGELFAVVPAVLAIRNCLGKPCRIAWRVMNKMNRCVEEVPAVHGNQDSSEAENRSTNKCKSNQPSGRKLHHYCPVDLPHSY
ncbi:hypothetical protein OS493_002704 [Desmophyllum pertusum]|uniref:Uncharacterized protein n=1 Tax=Desmophyllum pertusum TaxID=174260 RepID=A0A9W9YTP8_9CNID|nr:hypothetical protein OS493_002704 [Desmophyllum pertusum]